MNRDTLAQLRHLLRPMTNAIANSIARAVVQVVDDSVKLQLMQLGVLAGEVIDDAERFQEYGFSSTPIAGAEAVVLFPGGDRGHPIVVAVDDRRHRPTGMQPGEVAVYADTGAIVRLLASGDVEITPGAGREVLVRSDGGATEPLVKKSEFDAHVHNTGVGPSAVPLPAVGTTVLKAE